MNSIDAVKAIQTYIKGHIFSEAYENEEDFCIALNNVFDALKKYNPVVYGYEFAYDKAPFFNFGADTTKGARLSVPVRKIK